MLRASTILHFPKIRKFAVDYLSTVYPDELSSVKTASQVQIEYAAEAISHGRKYNVSSILKRAFFELACNPAPTLDSSENDSEATLPDKADLVKVLHVQQQLIIRWHETTTLSEIECSNCWPDGQPDDPDPSRNPHFGRLNLLTTCPLDPIRGIQELISADWEEHGYCTRCVKARVTGLEEHRKKIWEDLGEWIAI